MSATTDQKPIRAGVFAQLEEADAAVQELLSAGFTAEQLNVFCSDEARQRHFAPLQKDGVSEVEKSATVKSGVVGGLLGGLISLGAVATTGGLGILAVGPLIGGGVTGTLVGLLVGRGIEDEVARFYDQAVHKGDILVAVEIDAENPAQKSRLAEASRILSDHGARPVQLSHG